VLRRAPQLALHRTQMCHGTTVVETWETPVVGENGGRDDSSANAKNAITNTKNQHLQLTPESRVLLAP
jgi:hypothetical protein